MPKKQSISLSAFLGDTPQVGALPTGPRQREEGDEGKFDRNAQNGGRRNDRDDDRDREGPSRSEADDQWRRGGATLPPARDQGGYNDRGTSRSDQGGSWSRGHSTPTPTNDFGASRGGFDRFDRNAPREQLPNRGDSLTPPPAAGGERRKLALSRRTKEMPVIAVNKEELVSQKEERSEITMGGGGERKKLNLAKPKVEREPVKVVKVEENKENKASTQAPVPATVPASESSPAAAPAPAPPSPASKSEAAPAVEKKPVVNAWGAKKLTTPDATASPTAAAVEKEEVAAKVEKVDAPKPVVNAWGTKKLTTPPASPNGTKPSQEKAPVAAPLTTSLKPAPEFVPKASTSTLAPVSTTAQKATSSLGNSLKATASVFVPSFNTVVKTTQVAQERELREAEERKTKEQAEKKRKEEEAAKAKEEEERKQREEAERKLKEEEEAKAKKEEEARKRKEEEEAKKVKKVEVDEEGFVTIKVLKKDKSGATTSVKISKKDDMKALKDKKRRKKREKERAPKPVMNSRAADFASAEGVSNKPIGGGGEGEGVIVKKQFPVAPAPQVNSRFAKIIEEDKAADMLKKDRRDDKFGREREDGILAPRDFGDLSVSGAGLGAAVPLAVNSRFAKLESEREMERKEREISPRGGMPRDMPALQTNSRFGALESAPGERRGFGNNNANNSDGTHNDHNLLPQGPPEVQNSRFAKFADEDRAATELYKSSRAPPPTVQNSRFAAVAAEEEMYKANRQQNREEMGTGGGQQFARRDDGPPEPREGGRFGNLDYNRDREPRDNRNDDSRDGHSLGSGERRGAGGEGWGARFNSRQRNDDAGAVNPVDSRFQRPAPTIPVPTTKPAKPAPKQAVVEEVKKPDVVIALPGETQEEAEARVKKMKEAKEEEEREEEERRKKEEEEEKAAKLAEEERLKNAAKVEGDLLSAWTGGKLQGEELVDWVKENGELLPTGDKLVKSVLKEVYGSTPDTKGSVFEEEKWGAALVSLGEDNVDVQMEFLFGLQCYLNEIGFPKVDGVAVSSELMKMMYKYDICEAEAMLTYKDDEREEWEEGKTNIVIQCTSWFAWLEESDDDDSEDDDDSDEESD